MTSTFSTKAAILSKYAERLNDGPFTLPPLARSQVLLKMSYSPINPSDIHFTNGKYGFRKVLPTVPGFEGSGIIEQVSDDLKSGNYIGRHVACLADETLPGSWAQHMVTPLKNCLLLDNNMDLKQSAFGLINPLTALGFLEKVKKHQAKCVIQTAGYSSVGQMVFRLFSQHNIKVINIVRRDESVELLKEMGSQFNLNSESETFGKDLERLVKELQPSVLLDCVGADLTGKIIEKMPNNSSVFVYGAFTRSYMTGINPVDLIFRGTAIQGFWVTKWVGNQFLNEETELTKELKKLLKDKTFQTKTAQEFGLESIVEAVQNYGKVSGKILLKLN